jgi:hypothetical protein
MMKTCISVACDLWSQWFNIPCVHCIYIIGMMVLLGCNGSPTGPSDYTIYETEWAIAVADLQARGVPKERLDRLSWSSFTYRPTKGLFYCGDILTGGCYYSTGTIKWCECTPTALRHEMGHGILHRLGYRCWTDYQHEGTDGCPVVPTLQ